MDRVLSMIDLDKALVMKGLLFPPMHLFSLEHDDTIHSGIY